MHALAHIPLMLLDRLIVQKATFAGVTLFRGEHLYPYELRFVGKHLDKAGVRDLDKVLISALAESDLLFPLRIMPDDQRPDPSGYEQINNPFGCTMQQVLDASVAFVGQLLKLP